MCKTKITDDTEYGLLIKTTPKSNDQKEHEIIQVEKNSLGFKAGLKINDIILEINNKTVCEMSHKQVISSIVDSGQDLVEIVVIQK